MVVASVETRMRYVHFKLYKLWLEDQTLRDYLIILAVSHNHAKYLAAHEPDSKESIDRMTKLVLGYLDESFRLPDYHVSLANAEEWIRVYLTADQLRLFELDPDRKKFVVAYITEASLRVLQQAPERILCADDYRAWFSQALGWHESQKAAPQAPPVNYPHYDEVR